MKKDFWKRLVGKGYYIALILCAVAIGISGFVYYRTAGLEAPPADVPVDATGPLEGASLSDKSTTPTQTERKPLKLRMPVEPTGTVSKLFRPSTSRRTTATQAGMIHFIFFIMCILSPELIRTVLSCGIAVS